MASLTSVQRGGKTLQTKTRTVARTMTTATALARLPKGSRIIALVLHGVASDAGTTATLSIGNTTTATEYVNGVNVLAAGVGDGTNVLAGVAGAFSSVLTSDTTIYALYAETGTASEAGAWVLHIVYSTGNLQSDVL